MLCLHHIFLKNDFICTSACSNYYNKIRISFTCLGFGYCVCTQNFFSHCLFAASTHYSQVTVRCASFQLLNCSKNKENYKKWTLNQHNLLEVWYHTFYLVQNFLHWVKCFLQHGRTFRWITKRRIQRSLWRIWQGKKNISIILSYLVMNLKLNDKWLLHVY